MFHSQLKRPIVLYLVILNCVQLFWKKCTVVKSQLYLCSSIFDDPLSLETYCIIGEESTHCRLERLVLSSPLFCV